ncbi:MAG: hypothetical protein ACKPA7_16745, partial [Sphaerospermopsis kisseleviana]
MKEFTRQILVQGVFQMWGNYIYVPRTNEQNQAGGFSLSEVVSHEFFPVGFKYSRDEEGRKVARLRVTLKWNEHSLNFFGSIAENLFS